MKSKTRLNAIGYNSFDTRYFIMNYYYILINYFYYQSGAISKLHLDQQGAKTRRAEVEKTLLGDGKELEETKATFKDQASGTGFKTDKNVIIAREWAKILRKEGVIRINKCFDRFMNIITTITVIFNIIILKVSKLKICLTLW